MKKSAKELWQQYGHLLLLLYAIPYAIWFTWLQCRTGVDHSVIQCSWDQSVPFLDFFIIPYVFWYFYLAAGIFYFAFRSKQDFIPMGIMLISGMTFALLVYTFFPNALELRRPLEQDNFFTALIGLLRSIDPPNNVCPSLHVYDTLVIHTAICSSRHLKEKKWYPILLAGSWIAAILICASTVFIQQHSVLDVLAALVLWLILYLLVYKVIYSKRA